MLNLEGKRILVTGENSMIGREVRKVLIGRNAQAFPVNRVDLTNTEETYYFMKSVQADYVIHLAGYNGGIIWNKKYPADIFNATARMAVNVLHNCQRFGVQKVVSVISSCAYPDLGQEALKESELWNGLPADSVECHGLSKRILHAYSKQLNKQYGTNAVCVILNNAIGKFDRFDVERGKAGAALIRKFVEAKEKELPSVQCLGSGQERREFINATDAAEGIVQSLEKYDNVQIPLNISSGQDYSIKELVDLIVKHTNYSGEVLWEGESRGQMRKLLDNTRTKEYLDIKFTPFEETIATTVEWYINNKDTWRK